jgi:hypothetical protein
MELTTASTLEAFCNVRRDGNCCSLDLPRESEVLRKASLTGELINSPGERSGLLPRDQIFKSLNAFVHSSILSSSVLSPRCSVLSPRQGTMTCSLVMMKGSRPDAIKLTSSARVRAYSGVVADSRIAGVSSNQVIATPS